MAREEHPHRRARAASVYATLVMAVLLVARDAAAQPASEALAATPSLAEQARVAYVRHDFVAAARMYELLFADTGAMKYLFNAGMAREAAGNDGMAIRHLERYLREAPDIAAEERAQLKEQIAAARRRTMPVRIVAEDARALSVELRYTTEGLGDPLTATATPDTEIDLEPGTWSLRVAGSQRSVQSFSVTLAAERTPLEIRVAAEPPAAAPEKRSEPPRPALTLRLSPERAVRRGVSLKMEGPARREQLVRTSESQLKIGPGAWTVTARARGYLPREVVIGPELPPELKIRLDPDKQRRARIGVSIGLGTAGLAAIAAGSVVALRARESWHELYERLPAGDVAVTPDVYRSLQGSTGMQAVGTGILASGAGLVAAAASGAAARGKRALIAETSVGAGMAIAGAIGLPITFHRYARDEKQTAGHFAEIRAQDLAMVSVLSSGIGLLVGAVTGLLVRGRPRSQVQRVRAGVSPGAFAVTGVF